MKSALFVQANIAINTKLTAKVPFLFGNFHVFLKNLVKNFPSKFSFPPKKISWKNFVGALFNIQITTGSRKESFDISSKGPICSEVSSERVWLHSKHQRCPCIFQVVQYPYQSKARKLVVPTLTDCSVESSLNMDILMTIYTSAWKWQQANGNHADFSYVSIKCINNLNTYAVIKFCFNLISQACYPMFFQNLNKLSFSVFSCRSPSLNYVMGFVFPHFNFLNIFNF